MRNRGGRFSGCWLPPCQLDTHLCSPESGVLAPAPPGNNVKGIHPSLSQSDGASPQEATWGKNLRLLKRKKSGDGAVGADLDGKPEGARPAGPGLRAESTSKGALLFQLFLPLCHCPPNKIRVSRGLGRANGITGRGRIQLSREIRQEGLGTLNTRPGAQFLGRWFSFSLKSGPRQPAGFSNNRIAYILELKIYGGSKRACVHGRHRGAEALTPPHTHTHAHTRVRAHTVYINIYIAQVYMLFTVYIYINIKHRYLYVCTIYVLGGLGSTRFWGSRGRHTCSAGRRGGGVTR